MSTEDWLNRHEVSKERPGMSDFIEGEADETRIQKLEARVKELEEESSETVEWIERLRSKVPLDEFEDSNLSQYLIDKFLAKHKESEGV